MLVVIETHTLVKIIWSNICSGSFNYVEYVLKILNPFFLGEFVSLCLEHRFDLSALESEVDTYKVCNSLSNWPNTGFIFAVEPMWKAKPKT